MRQGSSLAVRLMALAAVTAATVVLSNSLWAQDALPTSPKVEAPPEPATNPPKPFDPGPKLPTPSVPNPNIPAAEDPFSLPVESRVLASPSHALPANPANPADPEAAAKGFVERSTREADEAIKALTAEADSLKARLQKVEAGLERWQEVKAALESHSRSTSRSREAGDRKFQRVEDPRNPFREPSKRDTVPPPIIPEAAQKK